MSNTLPFLRALVGEPGSLFRGPLLHFFRFQRCLHVLCGARTHPRPQCGGWHILHVCQDRLGHRALYRRLAREYWEQCCHFGITRGRDGRVDTVSSSITNL